MFGKRKSKTDDTAPSEAEQVFKSDDRLPPEHFGKLIYLMAKDIICYVKPDGTKHMHVETALCVLGALAGFGCQISVHELITKGLLTPRNAFVVLKTTSGDTYYYGDNLNAPLLEGHKSVWGYITAATDTLGVPRLDKNEIAKYVVSTLGSDNFGKLRIPHENQPHFTPVEALNKFGSIFYSTLKAKNCDPLMVGIYFAMAAQFLLIEAKDILKPEIGAKIALEAAVFTSKINPSTLKFER